MKYFYSKFLTILILVLFFTTFTNAQKNNIIWSKISKDKISKAEKILRKSEPKKAVFFQLDLNKLKSHLAVAPLRGESSKSSNIIIEFPDAKGNLEAFHVMEASVMAPELQVKHPDIRSYVGQSITNPSSVMRFTITPWGLHTMTLSSTQGTQYIDPYTKDGSKYIVYTKHDLPIIDDGFYCGVTNEVDYSNKDTYGAKLFNADDGNLRTYRLALACTLEYSEFHWTAAGYTAADPVQDRKDAVLAAMNVTVARVGGIYERELSIKLELIANNEDIIFIDTDPFTPTANDTANKLIDESQTQIDGLIGSVNYDIGHTFSTGAGGLAGLGVVCLDGQKARGVTGSSSPVGDAYDVDFVAHEMGHQFGANHTFNGNTGSCASGNRNASTAYEPGSGSTIMAYAGICSPQNLQQNSDDYFHQVSLQEIWTYVTGTTCANETSTGNNAPTAEAGNSYTIPISTPYKLTGSSDDLDGTSTHTYTWEEYDLGAAGVPSESSLDGPLVRSFEGTISPARYIPRLADLRYSNGSTTWEKLSSLNNRAINFQLTVRDNDTQGGQTATDNMTVTTINTAGPLLVTSQNDGSSWAQNTTETITWDVANTDMTPLNVSNVNIWLSTDGGLTYDISLASNTSNDGTEDITVPNVLAPYCRVMIEAVGNIFFNINTVSFPIGYTIVNICNQYNSTDPNLPISITDDGGNYTETSWIDVPDSGIITDVNVSVNITHPWVGDLLVGVQSPDETLLPLLYPYSPCQNEDTDLIVTFDDAGSAFDCDFTGDGLTMQSLQSSLSDWNSEESSGTWILGLGDFGADDVGTVNAWSLEICADVATPLGVEDFSLTSFSIFPNPNKGEFTVKLNSVSNNFQIEVYDMRGRSLFYNNYKNKGSLSETIDLKNVQSGMYLVKVSDGKKIGSKKIIIN